VSYVGIRRVTYHGLPDKVTTSIPSGIGAVGSAASLPNWLLCCVVQEGTSWGKDAWWRWRQNRRKKSGRRQFLQHARSILIDDGGRRRPMPAMGPHSQLLSIQQSTNILWKSSTLLKLEKKLLLIMFIPYTKAQCIDESLCMFVAGHDGCTADAEHRGQQQRHIYVVYVPPHAPCPWFGMSAMFRAMAAEVR
jgi:hypothetical protein